MPMPDGGTMSMLSMRMPGQSWPGAAASFLGMWSVMMMAMMLPSLAPVLWRYRQAVTRTSGATSARLGWLTTVAGAGYFFVWTAVGVAVFPIAAALSTIVMHTPTMARAMSLAGAGIVLIAGLLQLTRWKAHRLACFSDAVACDGAPAANSGAAWRHGLRLGVRCVQACAGLMAVAFTMGIMDVRVMALAAAAIAAERLAPSGDRVARGIGVAVIALGLMLLARGGA